LTFQDCSNIIVGNSKLSEMMVRKIGDWNMRSLATIQEISDIKPIEGADAIGFGHGIG